MMHVKSDMSDIMYAFGGKLVGTDYMKGIVAEALLLLPAKIRAYIIENCWFLSSSPDAWAYAFNGNDVANEHFIFLSDELLAESRQQMQHTILHEIGHVVLKHRNAINYQQTKKEIKRQERQADQFARTYVQR